MKNKSNAKNLHETNLTKYKHKLFSLLYLGQYFNPYLSIKCKAQSATKNTWKNLII